MEVDVEMEMEMEVEVEMEVDVVLLLKVVVYEGNLRELNDRSDRQLMELWHDCLQIDSEDVPEVEKQHRVHQKLVAAMGTVEESLVKQVRGEFDQIVVERERRESSPS
jgi:hypothetical protein